MFAIARKTQQPRQTGSTKRLFGPNGKPGITLSLGERFRIDLVNQASASTLRIGTASCRRGCKTVFPGRKRQPIPVVDLGSGINCSTISLRLFLLRSSSVEHGTQTQGRSWELRTSKPPVCRGLEPRADARTHPIGTNDFGTNDVRTGQAACRTPRRDASEQTGRPRVKLLSRLAEWEADRSVIMADRRQAIDYMASPLLEGIRTQRTGRVWKLRTCSINRTS